MAEDDRNPNTRGYWQTDPDTWHKLKPLAREMRHVPSRAENRLWQKLRRHQLSGLKFRRQHPVDRYILDFYCAEANLVVEIDGPTHDYTVEADAARQRFLESLGLTVLRFSNQDVMQNLEGVLRTICAHAGRSLDE